MSSKELISHDEKLVENVAELLGLQAHILEEVRSWSPQALPGVQTLFRGETCVSRDLISPTVRGCPSCLRGDVTSDQIQPEGQMVMQGHWQLRYTEMCLHHSQPLVPLWKVANLWSRYDFATRLRKIADDIMSDRLYPPIQPISPYDFWLGERLSTGSDVTWLSTQATDTAATFCRLLGAELIRVMPDVESIEEPARAVGFDVARSGPEAIRQALRNLSSAASGPHDGTRVAFGHLYRWLAHDAADDPRCDAYRELLREVILETWAIPAGEVVLGKPLLARRLHSVASASEKIGRSKKVARQILENEGIIDSDDSRPDTRLTFDAIHAGPTLKKAQRLVMAKGMAKRLGASSGQFDVLVRQSVFTPALPVGVSKYHWDIADVDALLASLTANAALVDDDDRDWVPLGIAAGRARIDVSVAIDAVRTRQIAVGFRKGKIGYTAICVQQTELDELSLDRPDCTTLSEFGTEIGLQKSGAILALYEAGHMRATGLYNPKTRRTGLYVTDEDRQLFHARFTTLKLLSSVAEMGGHSLGRKLTAFGVQRFAPDGQDFGSIYLLENAHDALKRIVSR